MTSIPEALLVTCDFLCGNIVLQIHVFQPIG